MHRLVHLAMRVWIGRHGNTAEVIEKATRHIAEAFPTDDYANQVVWRAYLLHALRLLGVRRIMMLRRDLSCACGLGDVCRWTAEF
jgi:hypothetical protein